VIIERVDDEDDEPMPFDKQPNYFGGDSDERPLETTDVLESDRGDHGNKSPATKLIHQVGFEIKSQAASRAHSR
jgi:hypothetical protein